MSALIPTANPFVLALSETLASRVERLKLKGARLDRIQIKVNQSDAKNPKIWAFQFVGRASSRLPKFVDAANRCPHCGKGTIMCPTCGDWPMICAFCKKQMAVIATDHGGQNDQKIPFEPRMWRVLEGSSWDGSDLFTCKAGRIASKRFIDWLLRIHATPFTAEPVWFCVDGMNDEQQRWLKELEKPLEA